MICEANWCWLISPQTGIETMSVSLQGTGAIIHQYRLGGVRLGLPVIWGPLTGPENSVCLCVCADL